MNHNDVQQPATPTPRHTAEEQVEFALERLRYMNDRWSALMYGRNPHGTRREKRRARKARNKGGR